MSIYRVQMENAGFYVQPNMLQFYYDQGYKVYKIVEVELGADEISAEIERSAQETAALQESIQAIISKEKKEIHHE